MTKKGDKWDHRFLRLAHTVASWSKDPSTQVGAVITNYDHEIIATGYNGFPWCIEDKKELLDNREEKYKYVVHAEENAIIQALRKQVVPVSYHTMYLTMLPCAECAKTIVTSGIIGTVKCYYKEYPERWRDAIQTGVDILSAGEIDIEIIDCPVST